MNKCWTLALIFGLGTIAANAAAITYYDNSSAYLGSSVVQSNAVIAENFDDGVANDITFSLIGGSQYGEFRGIQGGSFHDQAAIVPFQATTISLTNGDSMFGFGGTFDLSPRGEGTHLMMLLHLEDGDFQLLPVILGFNQGGNYKPFFFGFTSDVGISSVTIGSGLLGFGTETYTMDDLLIAGPSGGLEASATPEPATFAIMGVALVALGLLRRRPKAAKQS